MGDAKHLGWHPRTGPHLDQRDGHVFAGNLLVGDDGFRPPLLRFEQAAVFAARRRRLQWARRDGSFYVRRGKFPGRVLMACGPVPGAGKPVELASLAELRRWQPEVETTGRDLTAGHRAIFRSPELRHYVPAGDDWGDARPAVIPENVAVLLGWRVAEVARPRAYPKW